MSLRSRYALDGCAEHGCEDDPNRGGVCLCKVKYVIIINI